MEGQESAKRKFRGGAEKKREKNKRLLSKEAEKCYNIIDIFRCKKNENTFEATESESVISNKTFPSIDINGSATEFSSKLISENEKQNNNKDLMVTSIDSSEKCVTETSLIVETDRHVNHMFNKPKTNEHHAFFKFHPIQILKDDNDYKINVKKTFYRSDGTVRNWLSFNKGNNGFYCTVCLAFSKSDDESKFISGLFDIDPKHLYSRIHEHENSKNHFHSSESYMMQSKEKTIDVLLFKDQLTKRMLEVKDRRLAFERIVDVVKLIGKRGMSFRGEYESAKDLSNPNVSHGNFLDIVLLLAKYDVTLNKHVQSVIEKANMNKTPGRSQQVTLLSKTTINYIVKSISKLIKKKNK